MTKEEFYKGSLDRHQRMADFHAERLEETGNEYHADKENYHREQAAKLTSKLKASKMKKKTTKKDTGPMGSVPSIGGVGGTAVA